jgi:hypothetical protein
MPRIFLFNYALPKFFIVCYALPYSKYTWFCKVDILYFLNCVREALIYSIE